MTRRRHTTADGSMTVTELARARSEEALNVIYEIMKDEKTSPKDKIYAAKTIIERGYGAAKQTIDINSTHTEEVKMIGFDPNQLSTDALRELAEVRQNYIDVDISEIGDEEPQQLVLPPKKEDND